MIIIFNYISNKKILFIKQKGNSLIPGERFRTEDYEEVSKVLEYKKTPGKKRGGPKQKPKQIKLSPRNYQCNVYHQYN